MNDSNVTQPYIYCKYREPDSDVERAVKMSALSIVGGFGLFGNVFTIVLAAKFTVRRNLHFLIMNMAVSDTLVILCALFTGIRRMYFMRIEFEQEILTIVTCCVFIVWAVSQSVSLVTLLIISIERYRITRRRAVQIAQPYSIKRLLCLLIVSWLISTIVSLHKVIFTSPNKNIGTCVVIPSFSFYFNIWYFIRTTLTLTVFLILLLLSISTLRRLSSPHAIEDNLSEAQRKQRRKRNDSAIKMVLYSLLLYCCCFSPGLLIALLSSLSKMSSLTILDWRACYDWDSLYFVVVLFLPILNSSLSPYIYFICLSDFRQAAKAAVLCKRNQNRLTIIQARRTSGQHSTQGTLLISSSSWSQKLSNPT